MPAPASSEARWNARIARARLLAADHPAAAELLRFYAALAEYQQALAARWAAAVPAASTSLPLVDRLDRALVLDALPGFLAWLQRNAPPRLSDAITARGSAPATWHADLDAYLAHLGGDVDDHDEATAFVLEALLQPLIELLVGVVTDAGRAPSNRCPACGSRPVAGVLREAGEGARRDLVCGLCFTEWTYLRVVCPSCGERQSDALPVFTAEQFPAVRLEACDTCRRYLKTLDATKDGRIVPAVDDLASVSLDLWAREQGYVRLRPSLLRV